jgi:hypothetical protein
MPNFNPVLRSLVISMGERGYLSPAEVSAELYKLNMQDAVWFSFTLHLILLAFAQCII